MKKTSFLILLLCAVTLLNGCVTTPSYNPFKISREEVISKVKTIGVMPIQIMIEGESLEAKKKEFENEIILQLEEKGYKVITPNQYEAIYEPLRESMGAIYDPNTGKLLEEKTKVLQEHAKREYLSYYDVDAILHSGVILVTASWYRNTATWHGTTEATTGKEGFWANFTAPSAYGKIPALSFAVSLQNTNGEEYFTNFGGIQLVQQLSGGNFINVPQYQILADSSKNLNAVAIAMNPLLNEPVSK